MIMLCAGMFSDLSDSNSEGSFCFTESKGSGVESSIGKGTRGFGGRVSYNRETFV